MAVLNKEQPGVLNNVFQTANFNQSHLEFKSLQVEKLFCAVHKL